MSAPAILPWGPKWTRMNLPWREIAVMIDMTSISILYWKNDLQNVKSCRSWWSLHFQMPQGQGWPGSLDLQDWLNSVCKRERESRKRERLSWEILNRCQCVLLWFYHDNRAVCIWTDLLCKHTPDVHNIISFQLCNSHHSVSFLWCVGLYAAKQTTEPTAQGSISYP